MTQISIHEIKKVVAIEAHKLVIEHSGRVSYCRRIIIEGDEKIEITLFADKKESLDIITKI